MTALIRTFILALCFAAPLKAAEVTVFAAASLGDAMTTAAEMWEAKTGHEVTLVLAGSSILARQIDAGAPADIYVSANTDWMDWLAEGGRILTETQQDIASNQLVLVAYDPDLASGNTLSETTDILTMLGEDGRLAVALPEAVPAGIYAKLALTKLGLWDKLEQRLAPTDNVRSALSLVAIGEAPAGVVYATDALAEPKVAIAGVFSTHTHPAIRYPAAVTSESQVPDIAAEFVAWLGSRSGQNTLADDGFLPPTVAQ